LAPWLVNQVLNIPVSLQPETLKSVYLLAFTIPVITSTAGLRGILEAKQEFGSISVLRTILGISMYASPLLILGSTNNLYLIVSVLVLVRVTLWIAHLWLCLVRLPDLKHKFSLSLGMVRSLLGQGGWMTVSNIIGPMMVYFDRFLIASIISATAVAYYSTPYDLVSKLLVFSGAISGVLFPLFSSSFVQNSQHCFELYKRGVKYVALLMFPVILILVLMANEILTWWINPEFAEHGAGVLRMIAIGVFMNSLAQIPFSLIQGSGRADLTAKVHATELPFYIAALWWLAKKYGIDGVAIAWALRACIDAAICFAGADLMFQAGTQKLKFWPRLMLSSSAILIAAAYFHEFVQIKIAVLLISIPVFVVLSWRYALDDTDRAFMIAAPGTLFGWNKTKVA
jgi:O-antigen/teichoic acid export membrane protein